MATLAHPIIHSLPESKTKMATHLSSIYTTTIISPFSVHGPRLPTRPARTVRAAAGSNGYGGGGGGGRGMVDESMIVLRKRIREARMAERNYEPPAEWAEWEKQYYARYDSDVLELVRLLQSLLMSTRPAVAVGAAALLGCSVPAAAALAWLRLAEAAGHFLSGLHLVT